MKNKIQAAGLFALCFLIAAITSFAHHGSAVYDTSKLVTVKGVVVEWSWTNPHCLLAFDVKDEQGNVAHWIAETSNPTDMFNKGWAKQSFKPGDEVAVTMNAAKNGRPIGRIQQVVRSGETFLTERPASRPTEGAGKP